MLSRQVRTRAAHEIRQRLLGDGLASIATWRPTACDEPRANDTREPLVRELDGFTGRALVQQHTAA